MFSLASATATATGRAMRRHIAVAAAAVGVPVVYHPLYSAPELPAGHVFPMAVFRRIHDALLAEGTAQPSQVHIPSVLPPREVLHLVHDPAYVAAFCEGALDEACMRRIGFGRVTQSRVLIDRTKTEVAGHGAGYCILNDLAIATEVLLAQGRARRVLIIDLDVHQGDGTAACFVGRKDVFTLSVHAALNFPARKQRSHLDVALPDGTGDEEYLRAVSEALPPVLAAFCPDLVMYDAGVDPHVGDALGRLALTDDGLRRRELLVLDTCLAGGIPVAGVVGGGYAADLGVLAARHCWLHRAAAQMWREHGLT